MQSTVTDRVAWSVGLSVTLMSPGKMAPIKMTFGLRTWVGPGNYVLDGAQIPPWEGAILRGEGVSHCKVQGHSAGSSVQKTVEPIEMPFGL